MLLDYSRHSYWLGTHVGTRIETPVTLPFSSGSTAAIALAAPVVVGMMLSKTPRPRWLLLEEDNTLEKGSLTQTLVLLAVAIQDLL